MPQNIACHEYHRTSLVTNAIDIACHEYHRTSLVTNATDIACHEYHRTSLVTNAIDIAGHEYHRTSLVTNAMEHVGGAASRALQGHGQPAPACQELIFTLHTYQAAPQNHLPRLHLGNQSLLKSHERLSVLLPVPVRVQT